MISQNRFGDITKWCLISNNRIYDIGLEIWNSRFVILWSGELTPLAWVSKFWDHKIFFDISQSHACFVISQNQKSCILISILTKSQIPFCDLSFKSIVNWHPIIFKQSKQSFSDFQNENKSTSPDHCLIVMYPPFTANIILWPGQTDTNDEFRK